MIKVELVNMTHVDGEPRPLGLGEAGLATDLPALTPKDLNALTALQTLHPPHGGSSLWPGDRWLPKVHWRGLFKEFRKPPTGGAGEGKITQG